MCLTQLITLATAQVGIGAKIRTFSVKNVLHVVGFPNAIPNMLWAQRLILALMAQVGRSPWTARDAFVALPQAEAGSPGGREMPLDRTHPTQAHTQIVEFSPFYSSLKTTASVSRNSTPRRIGNRIRFSENLG